MSSKTFFGTPRKFCGMCGVVGVKSLEKRQNELIQKLFPYGNGGVGVNATRLVVRAIELGILNIDHLVADEA